MWTLFQKVCRWALELCVLSVVLYLIGSTVQKKVQYSFALGNMYAGECDSGSENDGLNSGMNYYKKGFLVNGGLPDRGHPQKTTLYLDPNDEPFLTLVYTHYPPGPNWLIGLSMYAFGPGKVPLYRMVPITFSALCLLTVYALVRRRVGALLAGAAVVTLMYIPMTTEMMHGIFFHSYALVLLLVQMSFVYSQLATTQRFSMAGLLFIFLCGFAQGWLSFDYAFIASLYPLAIVSGWRRRESRRWMVIATFCSGAGFTFAHVLHLGQLWIYYGTLARGWFELMEAGQYRMEGNAAIGPTISRWEVLTLYVRELFPSGTQAREFSWILPLVALGVGVAGGIATLLGGNDARSKRNWLSSLLALVVGGVLSLIWIVLMRNHAAEGGHRMFLPRHFIVLLFASLLIVVDDAWFIASGIKNRFVSRFRKAPQSS